MRTYRGTVQGGALCGQPGHHSAAGRISLQPLRLPPLHIADGEEPRPGGQAAPETAAAICQLCHAAAAHEDQQPACARAAAAHSPDADAGGRGGVGDAESSAGGHRRGGKQ